jgi:hypothetical protein
MPVGAYLDFKKVKVQVKVEARKKDHIIPQPRPSVRGAPERT